MVNLSNIKKDLEKIKTLKDKKEFLEKTIKGLKDKKLGKKVQKLLDDINTKLKEKDKPKGDTLDKKFKTPIPAPSLPSAPPISLDEIKYRQRKERPPIDIKEIGEPRYKQAKKDEGDLGTETLAQEYKLEKIYDIRPKYTQNAPRAEEDPNKIIDLSRQERMKRIRDTTGLKVNGLRERVMDVEKYETQTKGMEVFDRDQEKIQFIKDYKEGDFIKKYKKKKIT